VAAVLLPGHRKLAIPVLKRAEDAIGVVYDPGEHDDVLIELAGAYADTDLARALSCAAEAFDSYRRYLGIEKIVTKLAVRDAGHARRIATTMLAGREQENALAAIARALIATRPLLAEEIAAGLGDHMILAEIVRRPDGDPGQTKRVGELIRQRLGHEGMGYPPREGELLGAVWPTTPCPDALSAVCLRNGSDLESVLGVIRGLLEKWAGNPPVTLVSQVVELLLSETTEGGYSQRGKRLRASYADAGEA
jgi:hypothetical protein